MDLAGLPGFGNPTRDVAHISAHVLVVGAREGVPAKVVAGIMGHTKVDTTLNVYTQVLDGAAREAAARIGSELSRIVQKPETRGALTH